MRWENEFPLVVKLRYGFLAVVVPVAFVILGLGKFLDQAGEARANGNTKKKKRKEKECQTFN